MRISDWRSGVCSSDLAEDEANRIGGKMGLERSVEIEAPAEIDIVDVGVDDRSASHLEFDRHRLVGLCGDKLLISPWDDGYVSERDRPRDPALGVLGLLEKKYMTPRSEEHTSELQSLMRISYAVFCLKKNKFNARTALPTNKNYET